MTDSLPTDANALAAWLRDLEERSGITRGELARLTGTDRKTIRRWLEGTTEPSGSKLLLLLSALGVRWEYQPEYLPLAVNAELAALRASLGSRLDALLGELESRGEAAERGPPQRQRSVAK